jgi:Tfp pilus assembly protein PilF
MAIRHGLLVSAALIGPVLSNCAGGSPSVTPLGAESGAKTSPAAAPAPVLPTRPAVNAVCDAAWDLIKPPPPLPADRPREVKKAEAEFARALSLATEGDHAAAREAFGSAIAADPYYGLAYLGKAESHSLTDNDLVATRSLLERAVELLPENPRVHLRYGEYFAETGKKPEAEAEWRCALELRKDLVEARLHLARLILERGDAESAQMELRTAIASSPGDVQAHVLLGDVLESQKKFLDAAKEIEAAAQLAAKSASLYRRASVLYQAAGNLLAAKRTKKAADRLDPPPQNRKLRPLLKRKQS